MKSKPWASLFPLCRPLVAVVMEFMTICLLWGEREWEAEEPYNNSLSSHGVQWDHHLQLSCPQNKAPRVQVLFTIDSISCAKDGGRLFVLF